MKLVDPARNPEPYYDFASENDARIVGVIETHPHADFLSSHLEIHKKNKRHHLYPYPGGRVLSACPLH
ncbi:MBL fold metallo-hydrolase [Pontibacter kalidii]|uniref:hypothetical protein n=1 Tax=Pontibacter kalidii TaxID=2592049 RepID=UPI0022508D55|nr:hypothetical protein [Pontibacter kalidii]